MNNTSLIIVGGLVFVFLFWHLQECNKKKENFRSIVPAVRITPKFLKGNGRGFECPCAFGGPPCQCTEKDVSRCRIGNCSTISRDADYSMYNFGLYEECQCEYGKCKCLRRPNLGGGVDDVYNTDLAHTIEPFYTPLEGFVGMEGFNRYEIPRADDCGVVTDNDGEPCNSAVSVKTINERIRNDRRMQQLARERIKQLKKNPKEALVQRGSEALEVPKSYDVPWWNWSRRIGAIPEDLTSEAPRSLNLGRFPSYAQNLILYNENEGSDPSYNGWNEGYEGFSIEGFSQDGVPSDTEKTVEGLHRYYGSRLTEVPDVNTTEDCVNKCASDTDCVSSVFMQDRYTPPSCFASKQLEYPNDQYDQVYIKGTNNRFYRMNNRVQDKFGNDASAFLNANPIQGYKIDWNKKPTPKRTGDFLNRYRHLYREEQRPTTLITDDASNGKGGNVDLGIIQAGNGMDPKTGTSIKSSVKQSRNNVPTGTPAGFIDPSKVVPQDYPVLIGRSKYQSGKPLPRKGTGTSIDFTAGIEQDSSIDAKTEVKSAQDREAQRKAEFPYMEHFDENFPFPTGFFENGSEPSTMEGFCSGKSRHIDNVERVYENFTTDEGVISHSDPRLYNTQYYRNYKMNNPSRFNDGHNQVIKSKVDYSPY